MPRQKFSGISLGHCQIHITHRKRGRHIVRVHHHGLQYQVEITTHSPSKNPINSGGAKLKLNALALVRWEVEGTAKRTHAQMEKSMTVSVEHTTRDTPCSLPVHQHHHLQSTSDLPRILWIFVAVISPVHYHLDSLAVQDVAGRQSHGALLRIIQCHFPNDHSIRDGDIGGIPDTDWNSQLQCEWETEWKHSNMRGEHKRCARIGKHAQLPRDFLAGRCAS